MAVDQYHLDYETASECEIGLGAYRYAEDPSTRILMFAIAKNDGEPLVWSEDQRNDAAVEMFREAIESGSELWAFNAQFEIAITQYRLQKDLGITSQPNILQWRCTAAMARTAGIPASLDGASNFLKLDAGKAAIGKKLIRIFSVSTTHILIKRGSGKDEEKQKVASPCPIKHRGWHLTLDGEQVNVEDAWETFRQYCKQDVIVEREVHKKLHKFELKGSELEGFHFDARMNHRGVPIHRDALLSADSMVNEYRERLTQEFNEITGLMPTQTAKTLEWLKDRGYSEDNLQAATMKVQLDNKDMKPNALKALQLRSLLSFVAVKKIPAMLNASNEDDRIRGQFMWYGAQATGRWSSKGVQLQNAKRPTIDDPDAAFIDIQNNLDLDALEFIHGNPFETVASCVRNFVHPHNGEMMLDADYSNIEGRVAAWICGQEDKLQSYREGRDQYKELASRVFGVPIEDVTKSQRFVGKVGELSLCFQTGAKKFFETCAQWGMPIDKKTASNTVKTYRDTNDMFPVTWRRFDLCINKAMKNPGEWFEVNDLVAIGYSKTAPFPRLLMRLPSGRRLVYPHPKIERRIVRHRDFLTGESREWETNQIKYYGQIKGHVGWGMVTTYSGSAYQSVVQATARDIMQHGCLTAQARGFDIFAIIHDQALAHDGCPDAFIEALCDHPDWLPDDFPLEAEGGRVPYYSKD